MDSHIFLLQLVLILFSARALGEIAAYFQIPAVIGELLAGVILGPSLLNLIEATPTIQLLAQIGIILLLFEVGIETDINRLIQSGPKAIVVALGGVLCPFVLGLAIGAAFNFPLLTNLFIASTLTATSIGITLRVLGNLKKQNSHEAQIILGAAVIDDIIGIVLLALLFEFSLSGEVNLWNGAKVMICIFLFFLISPIVIKSISAILRKWEEKSDIPGLLPTAIVSLILFFSWIAHWLDAPELLGGFAAGLALSPHFVSPFPHFIKTPIEFSQRIEEKMRPIIHLFTPIFFVTIGLSLNLREVEWERPFIWLLSSTLLIAAIIGKLCSGFLLKRESFFTKLVIGIAMIPRGEVGLIFAEIGLTAKIFDGQIYAALILVIAITTLFAPFVLRWAYVRGEALLSEREKQYSLKEKQPKY